ncbi:MAG TPA: phosphatase PAP2 family protein [Bacteroidota bacterium]|nr:phosphatase PAP2 family protein [Bacteroidota bacterium]
MRARLAFLSPVDALFCTFILLLSVLTLGLCQSIPTWPYLLLANLFGIGAIVFLARWSRHPAIQFIHTWYAVAGIFIIFKEIYIILQSLGLQDWDELLIRSDRFLFHVDPTVWISRFAHPVLTEVLQIAYVSYYFLMISLGAELYLRKERDRLIFTIFTISYGFLLSYIGYLIFPAVGPRFTLHDFNNLGTELPGLLLTAPIRALIDSGESIPEHVARPILYAQRDAFPSGHTQMTLIVMYLAHRYRIRIRWWIYCIGSLLIISTIYLRYHYVTDLIGGALFMITTVTTAPKLAAWWQKFTGRTGG